MLSIGACASISALADDACTERIHADERLTPLRAKLPELVSSPTMKQLADRSKPTPAQKQALLAYDEDRSFCEDAFASQLSGPTYQAFAMFVANSKKLRARLYSGEIDFGTFVSTDSDNFQSFVNYATAVRSQEKAAAEATKRAKEQQESNERIAQAQLEQQQEEFEAQQKRQKMEDIAQAMRQLGQALQRPRPVITNCSGTAYSATCTTY
jgi:predicted Zn-dependent peptidase